MYYSKRRANTEGSHQHTAVQSDPSRGSDAKTGLYARDLDLNAPALGCCHFYSDWKSKRWLFRLRDIAKSYMDPT